MRPIIIVTFLNSRRAKMRDEETKYIERFCDLSPEDQQRVIEFAAQLKERQ